MAQHVTVRIVAETNFTNADLLAALLRLLPF
jgi:hypothetical protein